MTTEEWSELLLFPRCLVERSGQPGWSLQLCNQVRDELLEDLAKAGLPLFLLPIRRALEPESMRLCLLLPPGSRAGYQHTLMHSVEPESGDKGRHVSGLTIYFLDSLSGGPPFHDLWSRAEVADQGYRRPDLVDEVWMKILLYLRFRDESWYWEAPDLLGTMNENQWGALIERGARCARIALLASVVSCSLSVPTVVQDWLEEAPDYTEEAFLIKSLEGRVGRGNLKAFVGWRTYLKYRLRELSGLLR